MRTVSLTSLVLLAVADKVMNALDLRAVTFPGGGALALDLRAVVHLLQLGATSPDIDTALVEVIADACRAELSRAADLRAGCPVDEREMHATLLAALDHLSDGEPRAAAAVLAGAERLDVESWIEATASAHGVEVCE